MIDEAERSESGLELLPLEGRRENPHDPDGP